MAARPGEENVATLFGDVHYFYAPPDARPCHDRFDKGSYVYLFENANERTCRIEIANHPGTADQDAFDGFLDQTRVQYSYHRHCVVSLTVADSVDQGKWHLPTRDPRTGNEYHGKLHSLDIYFWTQQDALQFVNGVRRVLPSSQAQVLDEPGLPPGLPPQPSSMSSVVQQLDKAAISNPQYGASTAPSQRPARGPPPESSGPSANFAPVAYNPAAPAAPEAIRHREKTPPPDEDSLNPLAVAVAHDDQKQLLAPGPSAPLSLLNGGIAPPPQFAGPRQQSGLPRAVATPLHPGITSPRLTGPNGVSFPGPPGLPQPPSQLASQPIQQVMNSGPSGLPCQPPCGHSSYSYGRQTRTQQSSQDYSIHQQVYQPEEAEAGPKPLQPKQEAKGRLEQNAGKLERGVTGMLKRFERKFG